MIDGNLAMNSHFENMSEEDNNAMFDAYLAAEKRKEAISFAEFCSSKALWNEGNLWDYGDDEVLTTDQLYDLYLQSLKTDNNAMDKSNR